MNIYVPAKGPIGAKLAIIGEAPSYEEETALEPFVGPSGRELNKLLKDAGINRGDCWLTNVSKFAVLPNIGKKRVAFSVRAKEAGIDINQQINDLRSELAVIQPNCILALGGSALWGVTGHGKISDYRGSILKGINGIKVVGSFHPAHLIHSAARSEMTDYWQRQVMVLDFKRAKYQSTFKNLILPSRTLRVARHSADVHDFLQRFKDAKYPSIDIENHPNGSCIPICLGIAFNKSEGMTVPLWNTDGISEIPDNDLATIWIMLAQFLARQEVVGANFGFDRDKIKRFFGFIIKALKSDVMLKAFVINPELPKNLAFNTSIYTEEPFYKNDGMYEGSIEDLLIGCARDSCVTKEVDEVMDADIDEMEMREFYENFVLKLHDLYMHIESNGFKIDFDKREVLLRKYITWDEKLRYQLWKIAGEDINVGSWQQVGKFLYDTLNIPARVGTGEEVLTSLFNATKNEIHRKAIELVLEDRRVKRTIGNCLLAPLDFDGRMRTSYFVCLKTGRTSTHLQESPIRPYVDVIDEYGKKKKKAPGQPFQTITKHGDIGADVREVYICDDGEIFLQADSSQAEARVVALLADDEETLKFYDEHDMHALTASWFFGGTEDTYSKKVLGYESPHRFAGKTLRHAGHLGAAKRRAAIELNTQARKYKINFTITETEADRALKIFHSKCPKIKQVFHNGIIKCLENDRRRLTAALPYGIVSKTGGKRIFFERWGDELFREAFSYIPQRTVSDNTKAAALRIRQREPQVKIILESHDALLFSIKNSDLHRVAGIVKEEMERPIDFSKCSLPRHSLVIPCELEYGINYKDLNKFKFMEKVA